MYLMVLLLSALAPLLWLHNRAHLQAVTIRQETPARDLAAKGGRPCPDSF